MYETTRKQDPATRLVGLASVAVIGVSLGWVLWNGVGQRVARVVMETTAEIIEPPPIEDEEPPPPPPVDVELPPPPPQVVLPEFTFDVPPPPNAIQQVKAVERPVAPPPAKPAPPPAPKVTMAQRPAVGRRFEKPEYPAASSRAKEEGTVSVSMCVDANGRISDVKLLKSSGFPRLDEATLSGLPRTRLDPAKGTDGKPMSVCGHELDLVWELPK